MSHLHDIVSRYPDGRVLVIGEYLDQVESIASAIAAPLVTWTTEQAERERIYAQFRRGEIGRIVLSRVANFAIDLPDANMLILSGVFGSRQEEAQVARTRPPAQERGRAASFFTSVSRDTREEKFAHHCKLFLTEQGYSYHIRPQ